MAPELPALTRAQVDRVVALRERLEEAVSEALAEGDGERVGVARTARTDRRQLARVV